MLADDATPSVMEIKAECQKKSGVIYALLSPLSLRHSLPFFSARILAPLTHAASARASHLEV